MTSSTVLVDARERDLFPELERAVPAFQQLTLSVGDFLIQDGDGKVVLALERKTAADLEASVRDGRLADQRARLREAYGDRAAFLIEGKVDLKDPRIAGPLVGLVVRHRFPVFRTAGKSETADLVAHLAAAAAKGRLEPYGQSVAAAAAPAVVHKKKVVGNAAGVAMLACVSGVSANAARAVMELYGSVAALVDALRVDPGALSTVQLNGRRLGKAGDKIAEALLGVKDPDGA